MTARKVWQPGGVVSYKYQCTLIVKGSNPFPPPNPREKEASHTSTESRAKIAQVFFRAASVSRWLYLNR